MRTLAPDLHHIGVATVLGTSGRAIGSTLASAGFGSLLTARLGGETLSPLVLSTALRDTFTAAAVLLCLGSVLVLLLKEAPLRNWTYAVAATSG